MPKTLKTTPLGVPWDVMVTEPAAGGSLCRRPSRSSRCNPVGTPGVPVTMKVATSTFPSGAGVRGTPAGPGHGRALGRQDTVETLARGRNRVGDREDRPVRGDLIVAPATTAVPWVLPVGQGDLDGIDAAEGVSVGAR